MFASIFLRENRQESNCLFCEEYFVRTYLFSYYLNLYGVYSMRNYIAESLFHERNCLVGVRTQFGRLSSEVNIVNIGRTEGKGELTGVSGTLTR